MTKDELYNFAKNNSDKLLWGRQEYNIPTTYYPVPTATDYNNGYFTRYFVRRYDGISIEVTNKYYSSDYNNLPKGLYIRASIKWFLNDISILVAPYTVGTVSAIERNRSDVTRILRLMPDLNRLLSNLGEFSIREITDTPTRTRITTDAFRSGIRG